MQKTLSFVAILVSLLALAFVWFRPPVETPRSGEKTQAGHAVTAATAASGSPNAALLAELELAHERIRSLESRINGLEAEQEVLAATFGQGAVTDAAPTTELGGTLAGPVDGAKVVRGLVDLEQKTELLEQDLEELGVFEHFAKKAEKLQQDYDRVFDETRSTKERLKSAMDLKKADRIDADVATALIGIWDESRGDDYATYFLLDSLEGVVDEGLRDRIFDYLPDAESPKMRLRAVSTLEPMLDDPEVSRWFGHLAENDPDENVRVSVARRLERVGQSPAK